MIKQKIAIYIPSIYDGGSERFAVVLSKGLADRGYEVFLLTALEQKGEFSVAKNVHRVILHKNMNFLRNIMAFRHFLIENDIDVCVAVGIYSNLVSAAANSISLRTKIILSERNAPKQDFLSWKSKLLRTLLYRYGDSFVFQTPVARAFYSKKIQKRGIIIPNPLKDGLPKRTGVCRNEIVAVGRLTSQKNYHLLLSAFAEVCKKNEKYTLHIYGQGIEEQVLRNYVNELDIQNRVIFEGFFLNVHDQIKDADIFVMTSDFEGLPNALMEAMAMGFPVISTDCPVGGPRMLIRNGENGLLVPVGDRDALSAAMIYLIETPILKERIAQKASEVSTLYNLDTIISEWEHFLNN